MKIKSHFSNHQPYDTVFNFSQLKNIHHVVILGSKIEGGLHGNVRKNLTKSKTVSVNKRDKIVNFESLYFKSVYFGHCMLYELIGNPF